MKRLLYLLLLASFVASLTGCKTTGATKSIKELSQINKVAVVSLTVSDWGGSVKGGGIGSNMHQTMQNATDSLLNYTEKELAKQFKVARASSFIGSNGYKKQTEELSLTAYVPNVKGKPLGVFTQDSRSLKRGDLAPEKAAALCQSLGVDGVFLIFSEWTVATGKLVPTNKALTKNIVSLWDAAGKKVFTRRVDKVGSKVLGSMGFKAVTPETIPEWTSTYKQSLMQILN